MHHQYPQPHQNSPQQLSLLRPPQPPPFQEQQLQLQSLASAPQPAAADVSEQRHGLTSTSQPEESATEAAHTKGESQEDGGGGPGCQAQRPNLVRISTPWADAMRRTSGSGSGGGGAQAHGLSSRGGGFGGHSDCQIAAGEGGFHGGPDSGGSGRSGGKSSGNAADAGGGGGSFGDLHLTPHWLAAAASRVGWPAAAAAAAVLMPQWQLAVASAPVFLATASSPAAAPGDGAPRPASQSLESRSTEGTELPRSDAETASTNLQLQQREAALQQAERRVNPLPTQYTKLSSNYQGDASTPTLANIRARARILFCIFLPTCLKFLLPPFHFIPV